LREGFKPYEVRILANSPIVTHPTPPSRKKLKLIIFDLDQTLVDSISVHDKATNELFKRRFGVDARLREIDFAGKSLKENSFELAFESTISHFVKNMILML
jgi:phosphoserine phosphatase